LNYVSYSPFVVPNARLPAARAAIKKWVISDVVGKYNTMRPHNLFIVGRSYLERWAVNHTSCRTHSSLNYRPPAPEAYLELRKKWLNSNLTYGTGIKGRSLK
jgi:hypothetical protein